MIDEDEHAQCVDTWLRRLGEPSSTEQLLAAFERAFGAIHGTALITLGEVTLGAILDRVLHDASKTFPTFAMPEVDATGMTWQAVRERLGELPCEQITEGARFILVELLRVLGSLTAEILTAELHAALLEVAADSDREEPKS